MLNHNDHKDPPRISAQVRSDALRAQKPKVRGGVLTITLHVPTDGSKPIGTAWQPVNGPAACRVDSIHICLKCGRAYTEEVTAAECGSCICLGGAQ